KKVRVKFLAPPRSAFTPNSSDYQRLLDIINKIQEFPSLSSKKKVKKQKKLTEIIDIIKKDSNNRRIVPQGSLIIPRNLRGSFKAYITSEPMYVSTNFFVVENDNGLNVELIYSWLYSVFGQIQLEYYSKLQEGARKSEKVAFESIKVPDVDELIECDLTSRGFYEFGSTNDLDREWSDVLGVNTDKLEEFNTAMYDLIMQRYPLFINYIINRSFSYLLLMATSILSLNIDNANLLIIFLTPYFWKVLRVFSRNSNDMGY